MKPLLSLLALSLASGLRAAPDVAPRPQPKPPSEALLAAACASKGGLLVMASGETSPDGTKDEPEDLFGAAESEPGSAGPADKPAGEPAAGEPGAGGPAASGAKKPKPKVLHLKARGKDKKTARKKCREEFKGYYARNGNLKVAVAPDVEGEISPADRERLASVLARSAPLQPLKNMSAKTVAEQQGMSKSLFDGVALSSDNLGASVDRAQQRLDRRAADAARQATMIADIHLRDQLRERERLAGQALSPDLRHDPEFRAASRAYTAPPSPSRPEPGAARTEPAYTGAEPSVLRNLSLVDVPPPSAVPTGGVSRGSIVDDVKAALTNLGVNVLGRASWRPRYGHDAEAHTPMKVTVHHSAGSPSHTDANVLSQIKGWESDHVNKGFGRMGYHWVINSLGSVVEGQGMELVGSHTRNNNRGNIGICLAGNYDRQAPSEKMIASLVGLTAYVGARYSMDTASPDFVRGHEHYVRKSCPGNNVMSMLRPIRDKAVELVLAQKKEKPGNGAFVAVAMAN